ncbi:MAG: hypothetical protein GEU26_11965 [Nitrososphaeraceae archaeon]|nr:hypothetical protein [Nitrososphaeraceae archaeon]
MNNHGHSDHDLKIRFVYDPEIPIVDKPTKLKFTVQRISTEEYLKDFEASIITTDNISDQFRNFKCNSVSSPEGLFEIITRVSLTDVHALAAFDILLPKM